MPDLEYEDIVHALSKPESGAGLSRRRFLQAAIAGAGVVAASPYINMASAFAASPLGRSDGILVLITMGGGNDSLNMVVPTDQGKYYDQRKTIAIKDTDSLPIAPGRALHPLLKNVKQRYDAGQVAVVQGVAVPKPDLSHFTSMATWMAGTANTGPATSGWLGRYLDGLDADELRGATIGSSCPMHLVGATTQATAVPTGLGGAFGANRSSTSEARMYDALKLFADSPTDLGYWGDSVTWAERDMIDEAATISPIYTPAPAGGSLTRQLTLCARLINSNVGVRVLNVSFGSFDTHVNEVSSHGTLYDDFDNAIAAFYDTLNPGWSNAVTLMTWSEFGRRVAENSGGTDHGTAGSLFVIGDRVKGGLYGEMPSLTTLDHSGNMIGTVDYRSVYASVLDSWLNADSREVLGATYENLGLFSGAPSSDAPPAPPPPPPAPVTIPPPAAPGYWIATADGNVFNFGRDAQLSVGTVKSPVVKMVATPSKRGAILVCEDGTVKVAGDARSLGSMAGKKLNGKIRDVALTPSGNGYWLLGSDGGIFSYGDAKFFGSTGSLKLNQPVVGMTPTPSGNGYWMVASDGGIFAFGDALFFGSTGSLTLNKPVVGIAATKSGNGYWMVASDGGIFAFGDAQFYGSTGSLSLAKPIVSMSVSESGNGYWFVASDGGVFAFGDAPFHGSLGGSSPGSPVVTIAA